MLGNGLRKINFIKLANTVGHLIHKFSLQLPYQYKHILSIYNSKYSSSKSIFKVEDPPFTYNNKEVIVAESWFKLRTIINYKPFEEKLVIAYFYTTWCEPCNWFKEVIECIARDYDNTICVSCNVEDDRLFILQNKIRCVPTSVLYRGLKSRLKIEGAYDKRLKVYAEVFCARGKVLGHVETLTEYFNLLTDEDLAERKEKRRRREKRLMNFTYKKIS